MIAKGSSATYDDNRHVSVTNMISNSFCLKLPTYFYTCFRIQFLFCLLVQAELLVCMPALGGRMIDEFEELDKKH